MDLCCGYILGIWVFDGPCSWVAVGSGDEGLVPMYYSTGNVIAKLNTCNLIIIIILLFILLLLGNSQQASAPFYREP